jgi:hypothetical protein
MAAPKAKEKKKTAMQEIHELLGTKNAKEVLENVTQMREALQAMATAQPIMLSLAINPVTGQPAITSSNLQDPKEDMKKLRAALQSVLEQVTENVINLAEADDEDEEDGETPDMPPAGDV